MITWERVENLRSFFHHHPKWKPLPGDAVTYAHSVISDTFGIIVSLSEDPLPCIRVALVLWSSRKPTLIERMIRTATWVSTHPRA